MNSAFSFFIAWSLIVVLFWTGSRFEGTRTIEYYVLWLSVVLMLVTHYKELTTILEASGLPQAATIPAEEANRQPRTQFAQL
jgi:predicted aspartyl protease